MSDSSLRQEMALQLVRQDDITIAAGEVLLVDRKYNPQGVINFLRSGCSGVQIYWTIHLSCQQRLEPYMEECRKEEQEQLDLLALPDEQFVLDFKHKQVSGNYYKFVMLVKRTKKQD